MTIDVRDQLRDYFEYVDEILSAADDTRAPASHTDNHQETIMLTPNDTERTQRSQTWWLVAAALAALAIGGVVLLMTRSDPAPDVPATVPEPASETSAARAHLDDLVTAVNAHDGEALRQLIEGARTSDFLGAVRIDAMVELLDWFEVVDGTLSTTTCTEEGDRYVECMLGVDARLNDADGFVLSPAIAQVRMAESGGAETVDISFVGQDSPFGDDALVPPEYAMREFRIFVDERHPGDRDVMFTSPGDGGTVRPSSTPESLELWQAHVEEFVNEWTSGS